MSNCTYLFLPQVHPTIAVSADYSVLSFGYEWHNGIPVGYPVYSGKIFRYDHDDHEFIEQEISMRETLSSFIPIVAPGNALFNTA